MVQVAINGKTRKRREREKRKKLTNAHDIYQLVVGEIGFPRREFLYEVAFWEVRRIIKGYQMRKRTFCDMTRWQTWYLLRPHIKPNELKKPEDLATFPLWEKEDEEDVKQTEQDVKEMRELIRKKNQEAGVL